MSEERAVWYSRLSEPSPVPPGSRIRLVEMPEDPDPIEPGTEGTVREHSNAAQLYVTWDSGRTLILIPGIDRYEVLSTPEEAAMARCPYDECTFTGTDEEVDEHRATGIHDDEPQAGSNDG